MKKIFLTFINHFQPSLLKVALIVLSQFMAGCYAYKPMVHHGNLDKAEIASSIKPGKKYKIKQMEGLDFTIKVKRIDQDNIYGEVRLQVPGKVGRDLDPKILKIPDGVVRLDNIRNIQRWGFSAGKTALLLAVGGSLFFWKELLAASLAGGLVTTYIIMRDPSVLREVHPARSLSRPPRSSASRIRSTN